MPKIKMKNQQKLSVEEAFKLFIASSSAKGLTEKTLKTYQSHFQAISKRTNVSIEIADFNQQQMNEMIAEMRKEELSDNSINSYTRTLKAFFSWCNTNRYRKHIRTGCASLFAFVAIPVTKQINCRSTESIFHHEIFHAHL